jgi:hypothetical protein
MPQIKKQEQTVPIKPTHSAVASNFAKARGTIIGIQRRFERRYGKSPLNDLQRRLLQQKSKAVMPRVVPDAKGVQIQGLPRQVGTARPVGREESASWHQIRTTELENPGKGKIGNCHYPRNGGNEK